ncbi:MAG: undecaprenyl-phosphate glucose phosphotransferase [Gammaproteobacteria bacterium]|nr:undecaprenyl-phosphate glucose phosphotransferase [Gammaproteobacteria bacterium]
MNEPFYVRNSLWVAFVALLQVITPAVVVVAVLYALTQTYGEDFDRYYRALAFLVGTLSLIILPVSSNDKPLLITRLLSIIFQLSLRWVAILAIVIIAAYITDFSAEYSARVMISWAVVTPILVIPAMTILQKIRRNITLSNANVRSAVFAGFTSNSFGLAEKLTANPEMCKRVLGFFDDRSTERLGPMGQYELLGQLSDLCDYVKANNVDVIFIALPIPHVERVVKMLDELQDSTASVYYVPDLFAFDLTQSQGGEILGSPVITLCESPFYGFRGVLKRVTDVMLALVGLVVALPILLVLALLIRLTSPGPVIFKQRRYGLDGRQITVYKFRSMYVTEDGEALVQASRNDPRITPVGRLLRRFSLDELPQLINVLQGRMSMVGPRPHAIAHNEEYRGLIKGYMLRHKVLPGITGLAQINGCRGETKSVEDMEARIMYDLEYVRNWTPLADLKILLMTVVRIFYDNKAY